MIIEARLFILGSLDNFNRIRLKRVMRPQVRYTDRFVRALSVREDYELHKRKVSNIFKEKGPYSTSTYSSRLEEIRQRKLNDLVRVRNQKLKSIEKNNSLMFQRLIESQQLYRGTSVANATLAYIRQTTSGRSPRQSNHQMHQVLQNTELQNSRMFQRLSKLKSTINRRKTESEYEAAKRHKERISRFEGGSMKKNLYVQKEIERKKFQSNYSSKSMEREKLFSKDVNSTSSVLYQVREINSFYTPQNIHRNRIREPDILTRNRLKQLHKVSFKPFINKLSADIKNYMDENKGSEQTRFFTTQIQNLNRNSFSNQGGNYE